LLLQSSCHSKAWWIDATDFSTKADASLFNILDDNIPQAAMAFLMALAINSNCIGNGIMAKGIWIYVQLSSHYCCITGLGVLQCSEFAQHFITSSRFAYPAWTTTIGSIYV
jgi:hypothetical protein